MVISIIASLQSTETVILWSKLVLAALCIIPLVRLFTARTNARRHNDLLMVGLAAFTNLIAGAYMNWALADANRSVALAEEWIRNGATGDFHSSSIGDPLVWQQFLLNMRPTLVLLFVVALIGFYANRHAAHSIVASKASE